MTDPKSHRFIADNMLGRLARWLRILGYDTHYPPEGDDSDLISTAVSEERIILTRDKTVANTNKAKAVYIKGDLLEDQLAQITVDLNLELNANLLEEGDGTLVNRCPICNGILKTMDKEKAKGNEKDEEL